MSQASTSPSLHHQSHFIQPTPQRVGISMPPKPLPPNQIKAPPTSIGIYEYDGGARMPEHKPPHLAELERATAELRASLERSWMHRLLLRMCDQIVRLDHAIQRRRKP